MEKFHLKIVASDRVFYNGECESVTVPGLDGEWGFMAHHQCAVVAVTPGELRFQTGEGTWRRAAVGSGFAQSAHNRVLILVDTAEWPEEVDEARAREALERAREELRQKQSIQEYRLTQASLARALTRLKTKRR